MADPHDTEIWKPVVGYEGLYEVSDQGRVRSLPRVVENKGRWKRCKSRVHGRMLDPTQDDSGRLSVMLSRDGKARRYKVHRIVLNTFVGPRPPGMECRHFPDRDQKNNRLTNLSWGTHIENELDKVVHGTLMRGEYHASSKLTADDVGRIFALRESGFLQREIGAQIGICQSHVAAILAGRKWASYRSSSR